MASNLIYTARKLIQALGTKNIRLTMGTKQFIGRDGRPRNLFVISEAVWNDERGRYTNVELYSTSSAVRIVLYLRDMWYKVNGWELPTDQEKWNKIRAELAGESNDGKYGTRDL